MPRYSPSLEEFRAAARRGNLIPVWRELLADRVTPVSSYAQLRRGDPLHVRGMPDAKWVVHDTLVIFDNLRQTVKVVANAVVESAADVDSVYMGACRRIDAIVDTLSRPAPPLRTLEPYRSRAGELLRSNTT